MRDTRRKAELAAALKTAERRVAELRRLTDRGGRILAEGMRDTLRVEVGDQERARGARHVLTVLVRGDALRADVAEAVRSFLVDRQWIAGRVLQIDGLPLYPPPGGEP